MKTLKWIVWILVIVAVLLIVLAGVSFVFDLYIGGINKISFFHAANSFLLLAIALWLVTGGVRECCNET